MMSKQRGLGLLALILLSNLAAAQDVQPLPPNTLIERELTSAQTHIYRIPLKAGQFVHFDVFQKSIDVLMSLTAPDGKPITEVDVSTFGLPETLSAIATTSGSYQLRIQTVSPPQIKGQYQLKAEIKSAANDADKKRVQAERLMRQHRDEPDPQRKLAIAEQARTLWAELGERFWEGFALSYVGFAHNSISFAQNSLTEREKGYAVMEQVLPIMREVKNRAGEGVILGNLGFLSSGLGRWEQVIPYLEQAVTIAFEIGNQTDAIKQLRRMGNNQWQLQRNEQAEVTFTKLLATSRAAKDREAEADALNLLGQIVGMNSGKVAKGIEYFESALSIARELNNKTQETTLLSNLSGVMMAIGKFDKAIEYAEAAIKAAQATGNRRKEAEVFEFNLASIYRSLGQHEKAREVLGQALAIYRESKDRIGEAFALLNLGSLYLPRGTNPKELECYEQALKILQDVRLIKGAQITQVLNTLGSYHVEANNPAKAIEYYQQSLANVRELNMRSSEPWTLRGLGAAYRKLKQYDKAIEIHERALRILREVAFDDLPRWGEPQFLTSLMLDWKEAGNTELAIFYGKGAINRLQELRGNIRKSSDQVELQQQLQQTFINENEKHYRTLADLLISQARLPEAEQVLRMLKEEEYFEYIRGSANDVPKGEKATLTPKEEAADKRYREVADKLAELGAERAALLNKPSRTEAENQRLANIEADLAVAGQAFQKFLDKLNDELKTTKDAGKVSQLRDSQGMIDDLRELGHGAVALYTVVGEDTFSIVLTTADVQKAYQVPIKATDLNRKVLAFRQALQNPTLDPLPLAQELYKILLAPVEKDLRAAQAQLLMWSLDGVLRYVPMAALHDGKQYLVESYRHAVFTPASNARLHLEPSKHWRALGLGVTKAHGEGVPALPGVEEEMRGIIKAEGSASGVLPGTIKLDEQFTQESMLTGLRERNNVVHIASHFQFQPGNETNSALLLGDGQLLSLAQIKALPNVFSGVELLTLSACNTATSGSGANGKEVEGFGVLAQRQGARAVVASLWPVADRSTMRLMQEFYQLRESGLTKAEAMRQVQRKMLQGELAVPVATLTRSIVHEEDKTAGLPKFKTEPQKPFAHPYYWAPFILIGNWK
ncbi:MAG: CHAT domain-containing protein [Blastocatellia bacterium]|nr:CHAT domain-containing protein [Blastocatellia bacterium]